MGNRTESSAGSRDPSGPHVFVDTDDPGIAAAAGGMNLDRSSLAGIVVTNNFLRKSLCGLPGCGKARHDPIHERRD